MTRRHALYERFRRWLHPAAPTPAALVVIHDSILGRSELLAGVPVNDGCYLVRLSGREFLYLQKGGKVKNWETKEWELVNVKGWNSIYETAT